VKTIAINGHKIEISSMSLTAIECDGSLEIKSQGDIETEIQSGDDKGKSKLSSTVCSGLPNSRPCDFK
jgi:hypothetical protein